MLRGIGPSLTGLTPLLADPILELHGADGSLIITNDNWKDTQQEAIQDSPLAPTNDAESAIIANLSPASYTAILNGKEGSSGIGLVEMYDLDADSDSSVANISTRGFVQTRDDVMIVGFMLAKGFADGRLLVRAIGPSLPGMPNALADPTLDLYDSNGSLVIADDNWRDDASQEVQITATGVPPQNEFESAIVTTLRPGAYTAVVSGKDGGTGVALVEVYLLR